jgi:hypothetical protein
MSVLPSFIFTFSKIPTKIPASYFMDINKLILRLEAKDLEQSTQFEEQCQRTDTTHLEDLP